MENVFSSIQCASDDSKHSLCYSCLPIKLCVFTFLVLKAKGEWKTFLRMNLCCAKRRARRPLRTWFIVAQHSSPFLNLIFLLSDTAIDESAAAVCNPESRIIQWVKIILDSCRQSFLVPFIPTFLRRSNFYTFFFRHRIFTHHPLISRQKNTKKPLHFTDFCVFT